MHAHVVQLATSAAQVQATAVDQQQSDQQKLLLLASLQLLANMCAASNDAACAIWSALYGPKLQAILGLLQGNKSAKRPTGIVHISACRLQQHIHDQPSTAT